MSSQHRESITAGELTREHEGRTLWLPRYTYDQTGAPGEMPVRLRLVERGSNGRVALVVDRLDTGQQGIRVDYIASARLLLGQRDEDAATC